MSALSGMADGSRAGKREQTVLTDEPILALLRAFWPDGVALDPCAPPEGPITVACDVKRKGKHPSDCKHCGGAGATEQHYTLAPVRAARLPEDGLALTWPTRTFANPPYAKLEPWLLHEQIEPGAEVLWYVPCRPNRRWWREWSRGLDALIALNPQRFKGYTCAMPAPLVLGYRGHRGDALRAICAAYDLGEEIR